MYKVLSAVTFMAMSQFSFAESTAEDVTGVVYRNIEAIGCHLNDKTCYITVDEKVGLQGECFGTSVRWYSDAINGKETFSMFLAAKMANKEIALYVKDGCFDGGGNYPTFSYMSVRSD